MQKLLPNQDDFRLGDKVRIRSGPYARARGVISAQIDGLWEITLEANGTTQVPSTDITNYSLAARKAWRTMTGRSNNAQK